MENKSNVFNTHSSMKLLWKPKFALFKDIKERGVALSFLRLQGMLFTTEIPQDFSGEEILIPKSRISHKMAQKGPFSRPKGGQTCPNHQALLINNKEAKKTELVCVKD